MQGAFADTSLVSREGTPINCHTVMLAGLSPFLTKVLLDSGGDQVILADHNISATCGLLNFLYTGMYVEYYSEPVGVSNGGRVWGEDMVLNGQKKS